MTKYRLESLTDNIGIVLVDGWTPYNVGSVACVGDPEDAWLFDSLTEAHLVLFAIETQAPLLTRACNFMPIPVNFPDQQLHFSL